MSGDQYPLWPEMLRWLNVVKDRVESIVAIGAEQVITGTFDPNLIPPIPWARVLKAGSSLGDLETRSASDLSIGTLPDGRFPALTGDISTVAGAVATTLATVNATPGTYGAGMTIPLVTVNAKGLVTDIQDYPIAGSPFTPGSVIFAGALGQFAEDNAGLFYDASVQSLGVGVSFPTANLHVFSSGGVLARLETSNNAGIAYAMFDNNGSHVALIGIDTNTGGSLATGSLPYAAVFSNSGAFPLQLGTDNTIRLTIDGTTGYLGWGTGTISAPLTIHSTDFHAQDWYTHNGTDFQAPALNVYRSRGTAAAPTVVSSLDTLGYLTFYGYNSGDAAYKAGIQVVTKAIGNWTVAGTQTAQAEIFSGGTLSIKIGSDAHVGIFASSVSAYEFRVGGSALSNKIHAIISATTGVTADVSTVVGVPSVVGEINSTTASVAGIRYGNDAQAAWFSGLKTRSASDNTADTVVQNNDGIVRFEGWGADGAAYRSGGYIELQVDGAPGASDMPGRWVFYTTPDGSATPAERVRITNAGLVGIGLTPTALLHLKAGTATANTAPFKFNSGTNLTTAEAGAMEYDGTDLFFTRAGTVRENVLVAIDNVAAPGTNIGAAIVNYYGAGATNFLGDPDRWLSVNVLGATYKIPLYN